MSKSKNTFEKILTNLKSAIVLISLFAGLLITIFSGFAGSDCKLAEPGGVTDGNKGLPIPYYYCGVWGENTLLNNDDCDRRSSCFEEKTYLSLIFLFDVAFWSLVIFGSVSLIKKYKK